MGNNINGVLHWNWVMKPYENIIKDAFVFRDKFAKKADKIFAKIRHVITQQKRMNQGQSKSFKTRKKKTLSPDIIFVGVHVR